MWSSRRQRAGGRAVPGRRLGDGARCQAARRAMQQHGSARSLARPCRASRWSRPARGGTTSLFVRGGAPTPTRSSIDGVPAEAISAAPSDFSDLAATGVERIEVLRGSNSVDVGSDALSGVINITTRRGASRVPEATLSLDGGNLGTSRGEASLGGGIRRFDYFAAFSHLQTDNDVANNAYPEQLRSPPAPASSSAASTSVSGTVARASISSCWQPERDRLLRDLGRFLADAESHLYDDRRRLAAVVAMDQQHPVQRRRSHVSLHQPVADRIAIGSIGLCQLFSATSRRSPAAMATA